MAAIRVTPFHSNTTISSSMTFSPDTKNCFYFEGYNFESNLGQLSLNYSIDKRDKFTEVYTYPPPYPKSALRQDRAELLDRAFQLLHLASGISYYKAAVPPRIEITDYEIPQAVATFFDKLYFLGLGEYSYKNKLDLRDSIHFPYTASIWPALSCSFKRKTALPIGGGKDSLVSLDLLKQAHEPFLLYCLGKHAAIDRVASQTDLPYCRVARSLDPHLFQLNKTGAHNGHIPKTAIVIFSCIVAALLYDFDAIALSNERSANIGNLKYLDHEINHQYSKGYEFELDLRKLLQKTFTPDLNFYSLLRPLSELQIAKYFANLTEFHPTFTSCNAAFTVASETSNAWCLDCPKCRFVFLALAPFLKKEQLLQIFAANLLNQESQIDGYEELLGYQKSKPFECVGEIEEARTALYMLRDCEEWKDDIYLNYKKDERQISSNDKEELMSKYLHVASEHSVPEHLWKLIRETF